MLDQQRQRSSVQNQANAFLARVVIITHLCIGVCAGGALIFHEQFSAVMAEVIWYLLSIGLIVGMCNFLQWCRITLGLWFLAGAIAAFIFIAFLPPPPASSMPQPPLSLKLMPFWLSTLALGYVAAGIVLMLSSRIERATARGFTLWEVPREW